MIALPVGYDSPYVGNRKKASPWRCCRKAVTKKNLAEDCTEVLLVAVEVGE